MCMPPLFAPPQRMAEPIPFLLFFPPEISSLCGTLIAITRFGTQEVLPTPVGKKYSTGSSPQWPWHTHPSPSLLSWHRLCSLFSCPFLFLRGATGSWFWFPTNSSIYPSLSGLSPQRASPFLQFLESSLGWVCLLHWLSLSFSRGILVSFLRCCSLAPNATKSSIPFGHIKHPPTAWWSAEVESAVGERRKAFAAAHRSDEDR